MHINPILYHDLNCDNTFNTLMFILGERGTKRLHKTWRSSEPWPSSQISPGPSLSRPDHPFPRWGFCSPDLKVAWALPEDLGSRARGAHPVCGLLSGPRGSFPKGSWRMFLCLLLGFKTLSAAGSVYTSFDFYIFFRFQYTSQFLLLLWIGWKRVGTTFRSLLLSPSCPSSLFSVYARRRKYIVMLK